MSVEDTIDEMKKLMSVKTDNVDINKILDKMIIKDKNIILKTDIENSKEFTILRTIESRLKKQKLMKSYNTLHDFCEWYIQIRISNKRKSRHEVFDAISSIKRELQNTIGSKLFGFGKNENS